jgi:hypothetical protein
VTRPGRAPGFIVFSETFQVLYTYTFCHAAPLHRRERDRQ